MKIQTVLKSIFLISLIGILFSGYLSYNEIFNKTCVLGGCTNVANIPACVYGFFMYLILLILSIIGLRIKK